VLRHLLHLHDEGARITCSSRAVRLRLPFLPATLALKEGECLKLLGRPRLVYC